MEVVPVIDLKGGLVVRARHGDRSAYRPIETPLSPTSDPHDVVEGLLALHPFRTLYAADLDAIEGSGNHAAILDRIACAFAQLDLWIDCGCSELGAARQCLAAHSSASLVLGSESQRDRHLVRACREDPRIILSLDFRGENFLGPPDLLSDADCWPRRLIVMTLARVGSDAGPDFERLAEIRARAGGRSIWLAGGLRNRADLAAAEAGGATGILVASALHDGRLTPADLANLARPATGLHSDAAAPESGAGLDGRSVSKPAALSGQP